MRPLRVLLMQARNGDDPMAAHELECVRRRLMGTLAQVVQRNAVTHPAEVTWLDGVDALFIGGSGDYSVHHPNSQHFVGPMRRVLEAALVREMPGFGLCFGHQLLGLHLGAKVETDPNCEEVGTVDLRLTPAGRDCPLFEDFPDPFPCHTGHSDHVVEAPEGVEVLVTGDRAPCQAFQVRGARFYSTQFHPDLTGAQARERYMAYRDKLDGHAAREAETRANQFDMAQDQGSQLLGLFANYLISR